MEEVATRLCVGVGQADTPDFNRSSDIIAFRPSPLTLTP